LFTDKNINFAPYNKTKSFINQTITYIDMADEQVRKYIDKAKNEMESSVVFLDESLAHIRAGKANTKILDGIKVDYYGTPTPLTSVATVTTPDAKTISIQPWEKGLIPTIEKAILASDIGITPANNGEIVRLAIPPLTEERRRQLVKQAGTAVEDAKISVRNSRREAIEALKKEIKNGMSEDIEKDAEAEVQKLHDKYIKRLEELFALKEKEIMTV
jgi:ribosome recycling factor